MVRKTSETPAQSGETPVSPASDASDDTRVILHRVSEDTPGAPQPIVATDANGIERPLTGGTFVRIDGKLQRREA
ncbi:hypothetical protein HHL26_04615 [Sphingobium sp. TB-6]|uniref:hypothetical protein n=1 Tax=Sphingobium sp. TB-6 TaxID=2728850 RepID=UPI00146BD249|nr:hypothetical protein [Sphingobium sp. TB-6]NML88348.1 hypothetical protein [Sphingobium sp. TB-6]